MASDKVSVKLLGISVVCATCMSVVLFLFSFDFFSNTECCVSTVLQIVNGHYRKVTVWGRKDSIVTRLAAGGGSQW